MYVESDDAVRLLPPPVLCALTGSRIPGPRSQCTLRVGFVIVTVPQNRTRHCPTNHSAFHSNLPQVPTALLHTSRIHTVCVYITSLYLDVDDFLPIGALVPLSRAPTINQTQCCHERQNRPQSPLPRPSRGWWHPQPPARSINNPEASRPFKMAPPRDSTVVSRTRIVSSRTCTVDTPPT